MSSVPRQGHLNTLQGGKQILVTSGKKWLRSKFTLGFIDLSTANLGGWVILCWGFAMYFMVLSRIPSPTSIKELPDDFSSVNMGYRTSWKTQSPCVNSEESARLLRESCFRGYLTSVQLRRGGRKGGTTQALIGKQVVVQPLVLPSGQLQRCCKYSCGLCLERCHL